MVPAACDGLADVGDSVVATFDCEAEPSEQTRVDLDTVLEVASTAGLNQDVFDALVVLAAGAWTPDAIATGYERVQALTADMDDGRRRRLARLGFPADEAAELSALHTRNFM